MKNFNGTRKGNRVVVGSLFSPFFFRPLCFCLLAWLVLGCTPADSSWERVANAQQLVVGLDPTFPPFENADSGHLEGLDVDLAHALGQQLGVEVRFVHLGYDGLYDALTTQQVDALLSAVVIDETKTKDFAYSTPYFNAGQFLVVRQEMSDLEHYTDLVGRTVVVELGSEGHVQVIRWERQVAGLMLLPLPSADEALQAVADGRADAAVVDQVSGRLAIRANPALRLLAEPVTVEPYALVVRQTDKALLAELNRALAELEQAGVVGEISGRWLD
jgi:ABC-type amino acid transport substrate-binding protein